MAGARPNKRTRGELTEAAIEQGVARLAQLDETRQTKRARCGRGALAARIDAEDNVDSMSPVFDRFVLSGAELVVQTTNFSEGEFDRLWQIAEDFMVLRRNVGRGKK